MLNLRDLEYRLISELKSNYDGETNLSSVTNGFDRAGLLSECIGKVIAKTNIVSNGFQKGRASDPPFMYFNGEIYQYLEFSLFRKCIREFLLTIDMKHQDWIKYKNSIMEYAKEPILLNKYLPHPKYIAFKNCVVDFETLEVHPFSPDIHIDSQLDYDYDMNAQCPKWEQFLVQVLPDYDARKVIQQYFGLAFLDRYNNETKVEKALILVGQGSNGKSVIFETIMNIFGSDNISNMDLNSLAKGGDEGLRSMAMLDGKRFNYCSEEQIDKVVSRSDIFKTLVSGEPIYARRIGENSFRIDNIPFLVFNMNKLPKFNDDTHGLYRRIMIVAFDIIIPEEMQDRRLSHKLKEERSGILRWLYDGFKELKSNGFQFTTSKTSKKVQRDFIMNQNNVIGWMIVYDIRSRPKYGVEKDPPMEISSSNLYDHYIKYCESNNLASVSQSSFGRTLTEKGFEKRRSSNGFYYIHYGFGYDPEVEFTVKELMEAKDLK